MPVELGQAAEAAQVPDRLGHETGDRAPERLVGRLPRSDAIALRQALDLDYGV